MVNKLEKLQVWHKCEKLYFSDFQIFNGPKIRYFPIVNPKAENLKSYFLNPKIVVFKSQTLTFFPICQKEEHRQARKLQEQQEQERKRREREERKLRQQQQVEEDRQRQQFEVERQERKRLEKERKRAEAAGYPRPSSKEKRKGGSSKERKRKRQGYECDPLLFDEEAEREQEEELDLTDPTVQEVIFANRNAHSGY